MRYSQFSPALIKGGKGGLLLPTPYSLLSSPYSLKPRTLYLTQLKTTIYTCWPYHAALIRSTLCD
ncbi:MULTISPECIES: hypothetical protein [unclassified Moorena]|uniref:hypothetical protein n=1 Tax=unclassified Moorena TaxID=2683338 RepID=UPI0014019923|nr:MULTISPECIES: hypothetical protein [unclassified Moorena]NEO14200.1 hypothetical protein [Moorena sp. SIO3E8]NEQ00965.1 hypothetical protein [Moorena sp. SIO3F7]